LRRDAAENRSKILEAARQLFAVRGLDTTMDEIAQAAGVGPGTLYRRFRTKEALLDALLCDGFEQLRALAESAASEPDAFSGLERFLAGALQQQSENRAFLEILLFRLRDEPNLAAARRELRSLLAQLLERAHEQGSLRPDVGLGDVYVVLWQLGRVAETVGATSPRLLGRYLALALDALRAPAQRELPGSPPSDRQLDAAMATMAERRLG
jgi:AcrR family transcriptional regulator